MSEVTTLKQLMLDAARYRWWRENIERFIEDFAFVGDDKKIGFIRCVTPDECDSLIDGILDRE